ncbi:zinc finger protein ZAT5-like [Typha latifolia]|uniref:zinc finger protein ZAT5-like n=1 Tax=Typha latifolia TaxID=4733 RepID=UPI003C2D742E
MEIQEETMTSNNYSSNNSDSPNVAVAIVKGKRTKRQRVHSPPSAAVADSSSASSAEEATGCITEEEEDMANCLILLAQGRARDAGPKPEAAAEDAGSRKPDYVYECKTCSKCFPSFQALGGHRASHRKPKPPATEEKKAIEDGDILPISMNSFMKPMTLSNTQSNTKTRVHECSICGSEFSSGQALGGHMRRHRPLVVTATAETQEAYKERNLLSLDLNLPAPVDDERVERPPPSAFAFSDKRPLVDCHY